MIYLLDTNVLSETRKRSRNPGVTEWIAATPIEQQRVSALTIGEIARGVTRLRLRGDHTQATMFDGWLSEIRAAFVDRITPVTADVAELWGRYDPTRPRPLVDALIGATAQAHGWTLVTRNAKDFEHTGVRVLDPFTT